MVSWPLCRLLLSNPLSRRLPTKIADKVELGTTLPSAALYVSWKPDATRGRGSAQGRLSNPARATGAQENPPQTDLPAYL